MPQIVPGVKVTSKGKPDVFISVEKFVSLDDAKQFFGGEDQVLALVNTQHATNLKNKARNLLTAELSDRKLRELATDRVLGNIDLLTQLAQAGGSAEVREKLIAAAMAEIKAEQEAAKSTIGTAPATEPADGEGE